MNINIEPQISNCCGAEATDSLMLDYGICPECQDYCEFIQETEEQ